MSYPVSDAKPDIDQNTYPLLHFFYHLATGGKLFEKVPGKRGNFKISRKSVTSSWWYKKVTGLNTFYG